MSRIDLLKKLMPGFIPLFVFIAADEIWGTKVGLIVAVSVGIVELLWVFAREKRFDRFILFDTMLLVALGGFSIILENDIFFKLKPGLIELILVVILAISAFSKVNIIAMMGQRYMKGITLNEIQIKKLRDSLKIMCFVFALHTVLVFWSAFFMSKEAWVFISGGLFYVLFGVLFFVEWIRSRRNASHLPDSDEEWVPLVDEEGRITGKATRSHVHSGCKLLHPVVHLHLLNPNGAILLQKRPVTKQIQPGKWDSAVGGHISFDESVEKALQREAYEEIGLKDFSVKFISMYIWDYSVERELVYLFVSYDYKNYKVHSSEVDEAKFWTKNQIERQLGKGVFTDNFEKEFVKLKELKII
jgi:isopentenyldiphosphate isomerase/intracellular septation protein A